MTALRTPLLSISLTLILLAAATEAWAAMPVARRPQICEDAMKATKGGADPKKALSLWDECLDTGLLFGGDKATALYNRGNALLKLNRKDEALSSYDQSIALAPRYAYAYYARGLALESLGRRLEAALDLETAVRLDGTSTWYREVVSRVYCGMQQCWRALDHLDALVKIAPNEANSYYLRGWVYESLGQLRKSLADYDKALDLNPKDVHLWVERGKVYMRLREYDKALSDMNEAVRLDGATPLAQGNRGGVRRAMGQWSEAIGDFKAALATKPDDVSTMNNLAWTYAVCPDPALLDGPEAVRLAELAVVTKRSAVYLDTLAAAYARAGRFKEAVATQDEAVGLIRKEANLAKFLKRAEERLELYKSGQPYAETSSGQ